jgi:nucleolar protein 53
VPNPRATIALAAVPSPHPGTSYNPPEAAHTALLRAAHEAELRRAQEAEALEATKVRILGARQADSSSGDGGVQGMLLDKPSTVADQNSSLDQTEQGEPDAAGTEGIHSATKPVLKRKTKQQRRKAEKLRAEVRC